MSSPMNIYTYIYRTPTDRMNYVNVNTITEELALKELSEIVKDINDFSICNIMIYDTWFPETADTIESIEKKYNTEQYSTDTRDGNISITDHDYEDKLEADMMDVSIEVYREFIKNK